MALSEVFLFQREYIFFVVLYLLVLLILNENKVLVSFRSILILKVLKHSFKRSVHDCLVFEAFSAISV